RLAERPAAPEETLIERADPARHRAVETAQLCDLAVHSLTLVREYWPGKRSASTASASDPAHQGENEQHDNDDDEDARPAIAPAPARRNDTEQDENEDDDEDGCQAHEVRSFRLACANSKMKATDAGRNESLLLSCISPPASP